VEAGERRLELVNIGTISNLSVTSSRASNFERFTGRPVGTARRCDPVLELVTKMSCSVNRRPRTCSPRWTRNAGRE